MPLASVGPRRRKKRILKREFRNADCGAGTCCNTCTNLCPGCVVFGCFRGGATRCCNEFSIAKNAKNRGFLEIFRKRILKREFRNSDCGAGTCCNTCTNLCPGCVVFGCFRSGATRCLPDSKVGLHKLVFMVPPLKNRTPISAILFFQKCTR